MEQIDQDIIDIIKHAEQRLGWSFDFSSASWLSRPDYKAGVTDAALILKVKGTERRHDSVLLISNPSFPKFVAAAMEKLYQVHALVSPSVQGPILLPELSDHYKGRSFALFLEKRPMSKNRVVQRIQKRTIEKSLTQWLCELYHCTSITDVDDKNLRDSYLEPLKYVTQEAAFSDALRECAVATISEIDRKEFRPVVTVQHGDFWLDNILLHQTWPRSNGKAYPHFVIDWGGANLRGYPFVDLLKYSISATANKKRISAGFHTYCHQCGLPPEAVVKYICASIGWLGLNRLNFPKDRYILSSELLFNAANDLRF